MYDLTAQRGPLYAADFGMGAGASAQTNYRALTSVLFAAYGAGGATIELPPQQGIQLAGTIPINSKAFAPIVIRGASPTTQLVKVDGTDLFTIDTEDGSDVIGGVTFEGFQVQYAGGLTTGAAFNIGDNGTAQNIHFDRIVVYDCPVAWLLQSSLQVTIKRCLGIGRLNVPTFFIVGSPGNGGLETFVSDCLFRSQNGGTGVILNKSEHFRMHHVRLEALDSIIEIVPGSNGPGNALRHSFTDVTGYTRQNGTSAGSGVLIKPQNGAAVSTIKFVASQFEPGSANAGTVGDGITLDASGGLIDRVKFVEQDANSWPGYGLVDKGATNTKVLGGSFCSNSTGIGLTASSKSARVYGADCSARLPDIKVGSSLGQTKTQKVGIEISGSASDVQVRQTDVSGNSQQPITVSTIGTGTSIADCEGYTPPT